MIFLEGKPVLRVVDEATQFSGVLFLRMQTADYVWMSRNACWAKVYQGPPDFLHVHQGSTFVSEAFDGNAVYVSSKHRFSYLELYVTWKGAMPLYVLLSTKIRDDSDQFKSDRVCLQCVMKAFNDTVVPERLCATLLVFGDFPGPPKRQTDAKQIQCAQLIDEAMKEVE